MPAHCSSFRDPLLTPPSAHGGQVVCEEALALKVARSWTPIPIEASEKQPSTSFTLSPSPATSRRHSITVKVSDKSMSNSSVLNRLQTLFSPKDGLKSPILPLVQTEIRSEEASSLSRHYSQRSPFLLSSPACKLPNRLQRQSECSSHGAIPVFSPDRTAHNRSEGNQSNPYAESPVGHANRMGSMPNMFKLKSRSPHMVRLLSAIGSHSTSSPSSFARRIDTANGAPSTSSPSSFARRSITANGAPTSSTPSSYARRSITANGSPSTSSPSSFARRSITANGAPSSSTPSSYARRSITANGAPSPSTPTSSARRSISSQAANMTMWSPIVSTAVSRAVSATPCSPGGQRDREPRSRRLTAPVPTSPVPSSPSFLSSDGEDRTDERPAADELTRQLTLDSQVSISRFMITIDIASTRGSASSELPAPQGLDKKKTQSRLGMSVGDELVGGEDIASEAVSSGFFEPQASQGLDQSKTQNRLGMPVAGEQVGKDDFALVAGSSCSYESPAPKGLEQSRLGMPVANDLAGGDDVASILGSTGSSKAPAPWELDKEKMRSRLGVPVAYEPVGGDTLPTSRPTSPTRVVVSCDEEEGKPTYDSICNASDPSKPIGTLPPVDVGQNQTSKPSEVMLCRNVSQHGPSAAREGSDKLRRRLVTTVHVLKLGAFKFKGSTEDVELVQLLTDSLITRKFWFPAEAPKGKGKRVKAATGCVSKSQVALSDIVTAYKERWAAEISIVQSEHEALNLPPFQMDRAGSSKDPRQPIEALAFF
eukprot:gene28714-31885_t